MIAVIAACARGGVIGKDGKIPWDLPGEQKRFRDITMGGTLIMGRKTYEDIGHPLDGRRCIVISGHKTFSGEGVCTVRSPREALDAAGDGDVFICGGEGVFRELLPFADTLFLTQIDLETEGDTYFPEFDVSEFELISKEDFTESVPYTCLTYRKRK